MGREEQKESLTERERERRRKMMEEKDLECNEFIHVNLNHASLQTVIVSKPTVSKN